MKAFVFPGQGAQKPGMGRDLFGRFPGEIKIANSILGYDLVELIEKNPEGRLKDTRYTQPALFVVNALRYLSESEGRKPDFLAGHSLGEYNALWAAGSFDFETGLRLVKARGEAMSHAPRGSMAAVIGLAADRTLEVLARSGLASVDIANINTGNQIVLSFPSEVLENLERIILGSGAKAFIRLEVGGAFHSRYMESASQEFLSVLKTCELEDPSIPVISNVTARPYEPGDIHELLGRQITNGVQWLGTVEYLLARGVKDFVECGPGDILSRMIRSIREASRKGPSRISAPDSNIAAEASGLAWLRGDPGFRQCLENVLAKALEGPDGKVRLPEWIVLSNHHGGDVLELLLRELKAYLPDQRTCPSILLCATDKSDSLPKTDELLGFPLHTARISAHSPAEILDELRKKGVQDTRSILYLHMRPDPIADSPSNTDVSKAAPRLDRGWSEFFESWESVLEKNPFGMIQLSTTPPAEGGDRGSRLEDVRDAMSGRSSPTAHGLGLLAAQKGLLLEAAEVLDNGRIAGSKGALLRFCNRGYRIRYAAEADLPALLSLEKACWKKGDRCNEAALRRRLSMYPEGQFVLEMDGKVVAVLYTQRIRNQDELKAVPYDRIHEVHDPLGRIVQFVAVNVLPAYQERRLGDQLLEYALCINGLDPWIASAVAITKCKDFHRDPEKSVERYIQKRTADGRLVDPILRFHELHGAEVVRAMAGYRPLDRENQGYGVLVQYDLAKRKRQEIEFAKVDPARGEEPLAPWLTAQVKDMLGKEGSSAFGMEHPLMEMGLESSSLLDLGERLSLRLGRRLEPDFFYRHSNIKSIIGALSENGTAGVPRPAKHEVREDADASPADDVAIVGISCRLPAGIDSPDAFWDFLASGKSAIGHAPGDRWSWPEGSEPDSKPGIKLGGYLEDIKGFDAPFFRISPLEAEMMDPQQRLLLELSWKALEDGAIEPGTLSGTQTGVFVGASGSDYRLLMEQKKIPMLPSMGTGTSMAILANRLSYFYGLTAPSLLVDTACSSSLVAVHEAMEFLRKDPSHQAIVAGINVICHPGTTLAYYDAGMLSPEGCCKTFDASADGYVRSEGAVVIVLKRLSAALRDGNPIHAIIKGSSCNHGGTAGGLTVPNPGQQAALVREAWADGKLTANRFGLIETHGTGTPMGDPIEIQGLKEAYAASMDPRGDLAPCVLGAVKTNLGHLEAAAGLAGLLKAVLCIENKAIPGNFGFRNLNPAIELEGTPFEIRAAHGEWRASEGVPRVAGVSSFGSGGTNAHVALEEYVAPGERSSERAAPRVFVLSAKSRSSLKEYAASFHRYLSSRAGSGVDLDSLAHTMSRRKQMKHRFAMVFTTREELMAGLRHFAEGTPGEYVTGDLEADQEHFFFSAIQDNEADCIALCRKFCRGDAQWETGDSKGRVGGAGDRLPKLLSGLPTYPFDRRPHWFEQPSSQMESAPAPVPRVAPSRKGERRKISLAHPSEMFRFGPKSGDARAKIQLQRPNAAKGGRILVTEMKPGIFVWSLAEDARNAGMKGILDELESLLDSSTGRKGIKALVFDVFAGNAWDGKEERKRFWDSGLPLKISKLPVPTVARLRDSTGAMGLAFGALCDLVVGPNAARAHFGKYEGDFILHERAIVRERFGNTFGELLVPACPEAGEQDDLDQLLESIAGQSELAHTLLKAHLGRNMVSRLSNPFELTPVSRSMEGYPAERSHSGPDKGERIPLGHDCVSLEVRQNGVAIVRMKETEGKNTFTDAFVAGVEEAFSRIAMNETIKAVVLTGYDAYFCAGGTKKLLLDIQSRATKFTDIGIYSIALECAVPVIAAMQGHAIGAGWSMGMYCDLQVYSEESIYCSPYMSYGFTPGAGATLVFPAKLGSGLANEILMLAREYKGSELARRGATKHCYPRAEVLDRAIAIADALASEDRDTLVRKKREAFGRLAGSLSANYQAELVMHEKSFVDNADVKKRIEAQFGGGMESNGGGVAHAAPVPVEGAGGVKRFLRKSLCEELRMEAASVSDSRSFSEMGLDSVTGVTWLRKINKEYRLKIPATMVYAHPNLAAFSEYVKGMLNGANQNGKANGVVAAPEIDYPKPVPAEGTSGIKRFLRKSLCEELRMEPASVSDSRSFSEMGLDSVTGVTWLRKVNKEYGLKIPATMVYAHPNLAAFSEYVKGMLNEGGAAENTGAVEVAPRREPVSAPADNAASVGGGRVKQEYGQKKIAVIGLAGQYPMADDLKAFWENIREGRDCIDEVPAWRWKPDSFFDTNRDAPGRTYSKWMGVLESAAEFDPAFFNLSPREAINMDPQQRVFLRNAWHCLEDAGIAPKDLAKKSCGVYVGCSVNDYHRHFSRESLNSQQFTGEHTAILAARIAYFLDLRGPCLSIDTACSSSLVAIASACDSLILGNCDMALAGGVCVLPGPDMHIMTSKAGMLSPTGKCRAFDAGADGFVPGEGVGVVLLKRLDDALRDGDRIQAVLSGWGVNQDGKTNGITAPNADSQCSLIKQVHRRFGIDPASIGLMEAHGTGTQLGDPIEAEGLLSAFGNTSGKCALGSLKSNVGHLLGAAGVAGLTKVILSLSRKKIPPTINFERLNPHIELSGSSFYISEHPEDWEHGGEGPRRGAVSSFGFSGTNCHVVVEEFSGEHAREENSGRAVPEQIFPMSAGSRDSLTQYAKKHRRRVEEILKGHDVVEFDDYAFTLQTGRQDMAERLAITARSYEQLLTRLDDYLNGETQGEGIYRGTVAPSSANEERLGADRDFLSLQRSWAASGRIGYLADLWARGVGLAWKSIFPYAGRRAISLPMYPFSQEKYWKDRDALEAGVAPSHHIAENSRQEAELRAPAAKSHQASSKANGAAKNGARAGGALDRGPKGTAQNGVHSNLPNPEAKVKEVLSDLLFMEASEIPTAKSFIDIGLDSIVAVEFVKRLNQELSLSLNVGVMLNYPSVDKLVGHLSETLHGKSPDPGGWEEYSVAEPEIQSARETQTVDLEMRMRESLSDLLFMSPDDIDPDKELFELGLDSIVSVEWMKRLNEEFGTAISAAKIMDYSTLAKLSQLFRSGTVPVRAPAI